ncbi:Elongation factor 1-beta [uncultured archaeon]|nr:Elongation factor 1-beta [uncultured archaeon]
MASVIVTLRIMPATPETNFDKVYEAASKHIRNFVDQKHKDGEIRKEIEEIGFGLKAMKLLFVMDENIGTTDKLEENIKSITGVESVEATDVRRAIG